MAQRLSKKKQPRREERVLKEQVKVEEGVFNTRTMLTLRRLFSHAIISSLDFIISSGKEADVYMATAGTKVDAEFVIVKIFRVETSSFLKRNVYITGDPRFGKIKGSIYHLVNEWCKKEYGNLRIASRIGANVPKPYYFHGNIIAMEFIGTDGTPSKRLKDVRLANPKETLDEILRQIKLLYSASLVHSDISEYNILMKDNKPYLIDFGQAVVLGHPESLNFLRRDISNIVNYFFKKYGIVYDSDQLVSEITFEK